MGQDFRYSLTRVCLRSGQLSLSRSMAEIFPDSGSVVVVDSLDGREMELTAVAPRRIAGIDEFVRRHRLQVNDTIQIRMAADGRITLTALPRQRRHQEARSTTSDLLDEVFSRAPLSEAEIRELHPGLANDFPLHRALQDDPRFRLRGGRWHGVSTSATGSEAEATAPEAEASRDHGSSVDDSRDRRSSIDDSRDRGSSLEAVEQTASTEDIADDFDSDRAEAFDILGFEDASGGRVQPEESQELFPMSEPMSEPLSEPMWDEPADKAVEGNLTPEKPVGSRDRARERERRAQEREIGEQRRAPVTPYPRGVMFPGEGALNSKRPVADLRSVNRAREALSSFGYTVEGLPHGMLLARAELGRKQHSVLIRVLGSGERLDWAALLARRREHTTDYLAVFGDHRDLHRLTAPAELARATLWSWEGVARVRSLAASIQIGPYDLEPHFEKSGMFGPGLHKFERSVGRYVTERGVFSAVLTRLAALRAPSVFVLDDLVEDGLSRDQVASTLETLGGAPFHLVARIDRGEYCLRHRVDEGLQQLSDYALSLSARLPRGRRERLAGMAEEPEEEQIEDVTA